MRPNITALLLLAAALALSSCGSYSGVDSPSPGVSLGPISVAMFPTGAAIGFPDAAIRVVTLETGERVLLIAPGTSSAPITAVLLPPLPASKAEK